MGEAEKKRPAKAGRILSRLLLLLLSALCLPLLWGMKTYCVMTGSMAPAILPGSLAYVSPVKAEQIRPGDVITYRIPGSGVTVTHRVVSAAPGGESFVTKGDANRTEDAARVRAEQVVGTVRFSIPHLGRVILALRGLWPGAP